MDRLKKKKKKWGGKKKKKKLTLSKYYRELPTHLLLINVRCAEDLATLH